MLAGGEGDEEGRGGGGGERGGLVDAETEHAAGAEEEFFGRGILREGDGREGGEEGDEHAESGRERVGGHGDSVPE